MRSALNNSSYTAKPCYLPVNYHYYGMSKIKAGKGYDTGKPLGVESGPCQSEDCDGTIITLKINTSVKGFETSTEKVCNICGRVYPLGFQIIGKPQVSVEMNKWSTHESWLEEMKNSQRGAECDEGGNIGTLPGEDTILTEKKIRQQTTTGCKPLKHNSYAVTPMEHRLNKAIGRLKDTPESNRTSMKEWRINEYLEFTKDCKQEHDFSKNSMLDIQYLINRYGLKHFYKRGLSYEDIIYYMFVYLDKKGIVESEKTLSTIGGRIKGVINK